MVLPVFNVVVLFKVIRSCVELCCVALYCVVYDMRIYIYIKVRTASSAAPEEISVHIQTYSTLNSEK